MGNRRNRHKNKFNGHHGGKTDKKRGERCHEEAPNLSSEDELILNKSWDNLDNLEDRFMRLGNARIQK